MSATIQCSQCGQLLALPPNFQGGSVACPKCNSVIPVQVQPTAAPVQAPLATPPVPRPQPTYRSQPAPRPQQRSAGGKKSGVPKVVWILGGVFGGFLLIGLICVGAIAMLIHQATRVDPQYAGKSLIEGRGTFKTSLIRRDRDRTPPETPPENLFRLVRYPAEHGPTPAYLGVDAAGTQKRPAMIWLFGGFSNGIGSTAWDPATPDNDQSASAFRNAGLIMMYPALRGGSGAPGNMEGMYGEVDDVLRAAEYLANQPGVDPQRIYLGGHSTGGSLAMLCAAASPETFRAVFAFGPVDRLSGYGQESLPYSIRNDKECELRDPIKWLHAMHTPTFVIEGTQGNISCIHSMRMASKTDQVRLLDVRGADHFNILGPITKVVAGKVAADTGPTCNIEISTDELNRAFRR